jgi:hypothetical protein
VVQGGMGQRVRVRLAPAGVGGTANESLELSTAVGRPWEVQRPAGRCGGVQGN